MDPKATARHLFATGVASIDTAHLSIPSEGLKEGKVTLLGSGKAAATMARAAMRQLGERIEKGFIVTDRPESLPGIDTFVSTHPIPSDKSVEAAERMLEILGTLDRHERVLYLLSGGTSAMLERPKPPLDLEELQRLHTLLLGSGASIVEMNRVRKRVSLVKGGGLAGATKASVTVAILSDVIGDDIATIGSAPFYDDGTTNSDAIGILKRYGLWQACTEGVRKVLECEPVGRPISDGYVRHEVIASNAIVLDAIAREARRLGFWTRIVTDRLDGDVREAARQIVQEADHTEKGMKICLLFGGETTVQVRGSGVGGRNQELALWVLEAMDRQKPFTFLSAGTDGIDGMSDAAGAVVAAGDRHDDLKAYLANNDSYHYHRKYGTLFQTGRTGLNVMDIQIVLKG